MKGPLKIIQISDIHLFGDKNSALLGVKTQESFEAVLDLIKKSHEDMKLIILSGDLSQDGSASAYKRIAQLLKPFNVPVYCVPGNHDDATTMREQYPYDLIKLENHIILENWQLILLNSQIPERVEGMLDQSQLTFLQSCLEKHPSYHTIVLFHHQPVPVGSKWLDALGVRNAKDFWQIIERYPNIKLISFGHVHQEFKAKMNGIQCFATPSTCIQFKGGQDHFGLDNIPPGYRWLHLYPDGHVESGIKRVSRYIGVFDANATGY